MLSLRQTTKLMADIEYSNTPGVFFPSRGEYIFGKPRGALSLKLFGIAPRGVLKGYYVAVYMHVM